MPDWPKDWRAPLRACVRRQESMGILLIDGLLDGAQTEPLVGAEDFHHLIQKCPVAIETIEQKDLSLVPHRLKENRF
jgi:hypothetical protein